MTQEQVTLPVQQLHGNQWNRKSLDEQALKELSDSIKSKGILEPILVRKVDDNKFEIASGERRWKAALLAGCQEVPCLVQNLTDEDVQDMNLICNIQKEDIPALEKAAMVKARMDAGNLTQIQIGAKLGKSQDWVSELLQVLNLPKAIQANLADYKLGVRPMQAVVSLPNSAYQEQIVKELQAGEIQPEHIERRAHQLHNGFKAAMAKRAKKAANAAEAGPRAEGQGPSFTQNGSDTLAETANVVSKSSPPSAPIGGPQSTSTTMMGSLPVALPAGRQAQGNDGGRGSTNPARTLENEGKNGSSTAHQLMTAIKDDVADAYLPSFGRVGDVMRTGLDTAWEKAKVKGQMAKGKLDMGNGLLKWGLVFAAVSWLWHPVMKTINYAFTRVMHLEVNQVINKNTVPSLASLGSAPAIAAASQGAVQKLNLSDLSTVPVPTGLRGELRSGQKILFTWEPVPHCFYNFYSRASWATSFSKENSQPLQHATALWNSDSGAQDVFHFAVTAVNAQDQESVYSSEVVIDTRPKP